MAGRERHRRSLLVWGGMFGVGFGAGIDVILFPLLFQHHHLLSGLYDPTTEAGLRMNVFFDGLFLLVMLGMTLLGGGMLWRTVNRAERPLSTAALIGAIVVGMGVFNVFDGVVDHYVLGLHDVVHETQAWNPHWIGVSLVLLGVGAAVLRWDARRG